MNTRIVLGIMASTWLMFLGACSVSHRVYRADEAIPANVRGVQYCLPQTLVTFEIPITRTVVTKNSPKDDDAKKPAKRKAGKRTKRETEKNTAPEEGKALYDYLLENGVDLEPIGVFYKIGTPKMGTRARPDPSTRYVVDVEGSMLEERALILELSESGLLTSVDSKAENKTIDLAVKTLEVAATIASKVVFGAAEEQGESRAKRIVEELQNLRSARENLVTGQTPTANLPAETLDRMLKEIKALEEALLSEARTVTVTTWTARVEVCLDPSDFQQPSKAVTRSLLYVPKPRTPKDGEEKVSDIGLKAATRSGLTIPPAFAPVAGSDNAERVGVAAKFLIDGGVLPPSFGTSNVLSGEASGFYYRSPVSVGVELLKGKEPLAKERVSVAQLGPVLSLPITPGGKATQYKLVTYPDSGGLKTLTIVSSAIGTGPVEGIGKAVGTLLDADKAANDELAALEREQKVLEAKKKIRDLQQELRQPE